VKSISETLDSLSVGAWLIHAGLVLFAALYVLHRYSRGRLRQALYWGLGLISSGIAYAIGFSYRASLVEETISAQTVQETFLSMAIALFYYACASTMTKKRIYSTFLVWVIIVIQETVIGYFNLILNEYAIGFLIVTVFFALPVSLFVALFFTLDYLSLRRKASLLIGLSFWFELALGPLFLIVGRTSLEWTYSFASTANALLLFVGFIMLAHSRR
jgi:hypothetical protein